MPYAAKTMLEEISSDQFGAKKNSDYSRANDLKKTQSATKQSEVELYSSSAETQTQKLLKKTGIPRVKAKRPPVVDEKNDEKRPAEEKHVPEEKSKKTSSAIEKAPNKKAQRAKGSTTIGKIAQKSRPTSSTDHISHPVTKEEDCKEETQKNASTPKSKLSKRGSKTKLKVNTKESKEVNKIPQPKKASWIMEKIEEKKKAPLSKDAETQKPTRKMSDTPIEIEKTQDREISQNSLPPLPSSTCSFFEKIQQGVRAYFMSKTNPIMRGVTPEESPTEEPASKENISKASIPREPTKESNITEGGMEPNVVQKSESKIQIPRLAAASAEKPHLFEARVMDRQTKMARPSKRSRKRSKGRTKRSSTPEPDHLDDSDSDTSAPSLDWIKSWLSRKHRESSNNADAGLNSSCFDRETMRNNCLDRPKVTKSSMKCHEPSESFVTFTVDKNNAPKQWLCVDFDLQEKIKSGRMVTTTFETCLIGSNGRPGKPMICDPSMCSENNRHSMSCNLPWNFDIVDEKQFWKEFTKEACVLEMTGDEWKWSRINYTEELAEDAITEEPNENQINEMKSSSEIEGESVAQSSFYSGLLKVRSSGSISNTFSLSGICRYDCLEKNLMADIDIHSELENYLKAIYCNESFTENITQEKIDETVNKFFDRSQYINMGGQKTVIEAPVTVQPIEPSYPVETVPPEPCPNPSKTFDFVMNTPEAMQAIETLKALDALNALDSLDNSDNSETPSTSGSSETPSSLLSPKSSKTQQPCEAVRNVSPYAETNIETVTTPEYINTSEPSIISEISQNSDTAKTIETYRTLETLDTSDAIRILETLENLNIPTYQTPSKLPETHITLTVPTTQDILMTAEAQETISNSDTLEYSEAQETLSDKSSETFSLLEVCEPSKPCVHVGTPSILETSETPESIPMSVPLQPPQTAPDSVETKAEDKTGTCSATQFSSTNENQSKKKKQTKRVQSENNLSFSKVNSFIRRTLGKTVFQSSNKDKNSMEESNLNEKKFPKIDPESLMAKLKVPKIFIPEYDGYKAVRKLETIYYGPNCQFATDLFEPYSKDKKKHRVKGKYIGIQQFYFKRSRGGTKRVRWSDGGKKTLGPRSSIEELLVMYNAVLRERKKNLRSQQKPSNEKATASLLSFIDVLLEAKKNNADTIKLPRITSSKLSRSPGAFNRCYDNRKGDKKQEHTFTLEEYVHMVQGMLSSALSIQQITTLNKITAKFQNSLSSKTTPNSKTKIKKKTTKTPPKKKTNEFKEKENENTASKRKPIRQDKSKPKTVAKKVKPKKVDMKKDEHPSQVKTNEQVSPQPEPKKQKLKPELIKAFEDIPEYDFKEDVEETLEKETKNMELSTAAALESFLKSQFQQSRAGDCAKKKKKDTKLLVTVKMSGEKIKVDAVSQIKSEEHVRDVYDSKDTSDLIIENIHGTQLSRLITNSNGDNDIAEIITKPFPNKPTNLAKESAAENHTKPVAKNNVRKKVKFTKDGKKETEKKKVNLEKVVHGKKDATPPGDFAKTSRNRTLKPSKSKSYSVGKAPFHGPYGYDQLRLKAQHPMEAIIESSESKLDDLFDESSDDYSDNRTDHVDDMLQNEKFQLQVSDRFGCGMDNESDDSFNLPPQFIKDLEILRRDRSSLSRTKSHVFNLNSNAKSMENTSLRKNIKKIPNSSRKINRKKMQARSCNVLCYANEKKVKGKILDEVNKGTLKNSKKTMVKTKPTGKLGGPIKTPTEKGSLPRIVGNRIDKRKVDPKKPEKGKRRKTSDRSLEFLYNDYDTSNMSHESSESEDGKPGKIDRISQNGLVSWYPRHVMDSGSSERSTLSDNCRDLPVFIHPPVKNQIDLSFPSLMFPSEPLLKSRSSILLTRSKVKALFKSNSDMRFFPGRKTESGEDAGQPFVTFVLTPKQKATAGVPSNQVKVVGTTKNHSVDIEERRSSHNTKRVLKSIEDFIQSMSQSKLNGPTNSKRNFEKSPERNSSTDRKKSFTSRTNLAEPKKTNFPSQRFMTNHTFNKKPLIDTEKKKECDQSINKPGSKGNPKTPTDAKHQTKTDNLAKKPPIGKPKTTVQSLEDTKTKKAESQIKSDEAGKAMSQEVKPKKSTLPEVKVKENQKKTEDKDSKTAKHTNELLQMVDEVVKRSLSIEATHAKLTQTRSLHSKASTERPVSVPVPKAQKSVPGTFKTENDLIDSKDSNGKCTNPTTPVNENNKSGKFNKIAKKSQSAEVNLVVKRKLEKRDTSLPRTKFSGSRDLSPKKEIKTTEKRKPLKKTASVYFDAEEGDPIETQDLIPIMYKPSEAALKSENQTKMLDEVMNNLQTDNVSQAITLLQVFFKKSEEDEKDIKENNALKLQEVLISIGNKSKNLMERMERSGWMKVLSRLDEMARAFSSHLEEDSIPTEPDLSKKVLRTKLLETRMAASLEYLEKQVSNANKLMNTITVLIDKTLVSEKEPGRVEATKSFLWSEKNKNDFLHKIANSLSYLKEVLSSGKMELSALMPWSEKESDELSFMSNEPEIPNEKILLQSLRKRIRQKRLRIQYLINSNSGPIFPQVQELKLQVITKLHSLEKMISALEADAPEMSETGSSHSSTQEQSSFFNFKESMMALNRKSPIVNMTKNFLFGSSSPGSSSEDNTEDIETELTGNQGILGKVSSSQSGFVNSLMKIWDTRSNECGSCSHNGTS